MTTSHAGGAKYAVMEAERRFLLPVAPTGLRDPRDIRDQYLVGTRLRLRTVLDGAGNHVRKLGHKVRALHESPRAVWHTSMYLTDDEWHALAALPHVALRKTRWRWVSGPGVADSSWALDVHITQPGLVIAELSSDDPTTVASWDPVALGPDAREVTDDEDFTGYGLATAAGHPRAAV